MSLGVRYVHVLCTLCKLGYMQFKLHKVVSLLWPCSDMAAAVCWCVCEATLAMLMCLGCHQHEEYFRLLYACMCHLATVRKLDVLR